MLARVRRNIVFVTWRRPPGPQGAPVARPVTSGRLVRGEARTPQAPRMGGTSESGHRFCLWRRRLPSLQPGLRTGRRGKGPPRLVGLAFAKALGPVSAFPSDGEPCVEICRPGLVEKCFDDLPVGPDPLSPVTRISSCFCFCIKGGCIWL